MYSSFNSAKVYTKSHEWIEVLKDKGTARVGITNYAQEQLGEIIHIEFPSIGKKVAAGQSPLVIESVKLAADVYAPVGGEIVAVNKQVEKSPTLVNEQAEDAWIFEIKYDK